MKNKPFTMYKKISFISLLLCLCLYITFCTKDGEDTKNPDASAFNLMTGKAENVGISSAEFKASVNNPSGGTATQAEINTYKPIAHGHVYSATHKEPTLSDSKTDLGTLSDKDFSSKLTGLSPSTMYYVRAYMRSASDTIYGNTETFTTLESPIKVETGEVENITISAADVKGSIEASSGEQLSSYGHVYSSINKEPRFSDSKTDFGASSLDGGKLSYTSKLGGLSPSTDYYVRAFAIHLSDTIYGGVKTFTTVESPITVITGEVENISISAADVKGSIESSTGGQLSSYGHVYSSTNIEPSFSDSKVDLGEASLDNGKLSYTSELKDLSPSTNYYVRAFAIHLSDTIYGHIKLLTTLESLIEVITEDAEDITRSEAKLIGSVQFSGEALTSHGHVYSSTSKEPTLLDSKTDLGKLEPTGAVVDFASSVKDLESNTMYYTRAYARNASGTVYGRVEKFTTAYMSAKTGSIEEIKISTAKANGTINVKGLKLLSFGHVYSSTNTEPSISDSKAESSYEEDIYNTFSKYTSNIGGLEGSTEYYIRAYVTTEDGTEYGEVETFTTTTVSTGEITKIGAAHIDISANIDLKSSILVSYGYVYSLTNKEPTLLDTRRELSKDMFVDGETFTHTEKGLLSKEEYYIRAYLITKEDTIYGVVKSFETKEYVLSNFVQITLPASVGTKELRDVQFVNKDIGYAVGDGDVILKTTDGGKTWTNNPSGKIVNKIGVVENCYAVDFVDMDIGFIAVHSQDPPSILKTKDGGATWEKINIPETVIGSAGNLEFISFIDENTGFVAGDEFARTIDGGSTWHQHSSIMSTAIEFYANDFKGMVLLNANLGYIITFKYAFRTIDGGANWDIIHHNRTDLGHNTAMYVQNDTTVMVVGYDRPPGQSDVGYAMLRTANSGKTWTQYNYANTADAISQSLKCITHFEEANIYYTAGPKGRIFQSVDDNATWTSISSKLPTSSSTVTINAMEIFPTATAEQYKFIIVGTGGTLLMADLKPKE